MESRGILRSCCAEEGPKLRHHPEDKTDGFKRPSSETGVGTYKMAAARHGTEGTQLFGTARRGIIWHGTAGMARPGTAIFCHFCVFAALYQQRSTFLTTFSFFAALYKQRGTFLTTFSFLLRFTKKEAHFLTFFWPGRGPARPGPGPGWIDARPAQHHF